MSAIPPPPVPEDVDEARAVKRENERALEALEAQAVHPPGRPMVRRRRAWLVPVAALALLALFARRRRRN